MKGGQTCMRVINSERRAGCNGLVPSPAGNRSKDKLHGNSIYLIESHPGGEGL